MQLHLGRAAATRRLAQVPRCCWHRLAGRREARWVQADRGVRPGDMRWRKTFWLALAARDRPAEQPALRCSLLRVHLAAWQQPDCAWLGSTRL